jgi:FtsP/CotA-like multicopper oxidase with cupredoxin domain
MFSSIFSSGKKNKQSTPSARRGVKLALIQLEERVNPAGGILPDAPLFASQDGVLHVKFTAQSVTTEIDGTSFGDVYTYAAELISGEETPGTTDSKYIQPTLQVQRGDRLIIDYGNKLPKVEDDDGNMVDQSINLHLHGYYGDHLGMSDNVLLSIGKGQANRYEYEIPSDAPEGLLWYHNHRHVYSSTQTYRGLEGLLVVGRADGNYKEFDTLQQRLIGLNTHVTMPDSEGNLAETGSDAGTLELCTEDTCTSTANGESKARVGLKPGENQIWNIGNISNEYYYALGLDSVLASEADQFYAPSSLPVDFVVVSVDDQALAAPLVQNRFQNSDGRLLATGGRVSILVTGPADGRVLRLRTFESWNGLPHIEGLNSYPKQVLLVSDPSLSSLGATIPYPVSLTRNNPSPVYSVPNLQNAEVDYSREQIFGAVPSINFGVFPNVPWSQPRAGSVEEWTLSNWSPDNHPFHLHERFQVMSTVAPNIPEISILEPLPFFQDVIDIPPALCDENGIMITNRDGTPKFPGRVTIRVQFDGGLGGFVDHCHRLPHEDDGMMAQVKTLPAISIFATGSDNGSLVSVFNSETNALLKAFEAFPGYNGGTTVAVADINHDNIMDVIVGTRGGAEAHLKVFSGADNFSTVLQSFFPFAGYNGGISVGGGDLNSDSYDDAIVGVASVGAQPRVAAFSGKTGDMIVNLFAFDENFLGGVTVASGIISEGGLFSLVVGAGQGGASHVQVYRFNPYGSVDGEPYNTDQIWDAQLVSSFYAFSSSYEGSISVACGIYGGEVGGYSRIVVGARQGIPFITVWSAMDESHSEMMMPSPPGAPTDYQLFSAFPAFEQDGPQGVNVGLVSTLNGADILAMPTNGIGKARRFSFNMSSLQPYTVELFPVLGGTAIGGN